MTPEGQQLFLAAAAQLELDVAPSLSAFATYHEMLLATNAQMNLTAVTEEREVILKHFVDSLSCLTTGQLEGELRVLDLGTGAGFPGIPLAIMRPQLQVTLLDATRRKVEFVDRVRRELQLAHVSTLDGRAEDIGRSAEHRERYDRVVTRAVSALNVLVELALPLLKVGGLLIAQKGPDVESELDAGRGAAEKVGGRLLDVIRLELPISNTPRTLVLIEKTTPTSDRYPRRPGVPNKHPLC